MIVLKDKGLGHSAAGDGRRGLGETNRKKQSAQMHTNAMCYVCSVVCVCVFAILGFFFVLKI